MFDNKQLFKANLGTLIQLLEYFGLLKKNNNLLRKSLKKAFPRISYFLKSSKIETTVKISPFSINLSFIFLKSMDRYEFFGIFHSFLQREDFQ